MNCFTANQTTDIDFKKERDISLQIKMIIGDKRVAITFGLLTINAISTSQIISFIMSHNLYNLSNRNIRVIWCRFGNYYAQSSYGTNPAFIWIDPWPTSGVLSERDQPWVTDNVTVHVRSQSLLWPEHCFLDSIFKFVKFSPFEMTEVYHLQYSVVTILLNKSLYGTVQSTNLEWIRVITKLPNSEQSYKGKVKTHNYINKQNQSTTGKLKTVMTLTWYRHF
jgi:hypothetical protein